MPRSQKRKKDSQVVSLFMLLGSVLAKAACRMLMKFNPGVNFFAAFICKDFKSAKDLTVFLRV